MNLNPQQQHAFDELLKFLTTKTTNVMYCLKGYAGTGKTYTIARVVERNRILYTAITRAKNKLTIIQ